MDDSAKKDTKSPVLIEVYLLKTKWTWFVQFGRGSYATTVYSLQSIYGTTQPADQHTE